MNDEKVFVDGMIIKNKSDGTPDWVKEKISLKLDEGASHKACLS